MSGRIMILLLFIAVVLVFGLSTAAPAQTKEQGMRLFDEGRAFQERAQSNEDLQKAVERYEQALRVFEKVNFREGVGVISNDLGLVFSNWGQYDKAVDYYEKSLAIKREIKDRQGEGTTPNNLGIVYENWGQYDKAAEYYEKSLAICRELEDRKGEGQTLNNLGIAREGEIHELRCAKSRYPQVRCQANDTFADNYRLSSLFHCPPAEGRQGCR